MSGSAAGEVDDPGGRLPGVDANTQRLREAELAIDQPDGVIAGGATKILSNVPAGRTLLGYPAMQMDKQVESYKAMRRLPKLMRDVAELRKAVFKSGKGD